MVGVKVSLREALPMREKSNSEQMKLNKGQDWSERKIHRDGCSSVYNYLTHPFPSENHLMRNFQVALADEHRGTLSPSVPVIMPSLLSHQAVMPEMSAQKYVNWFPPSILTKTDAFGVAFPGTSLAEITHILSAQSRFLRKRYVYISICSLMYQAESCHSP